MDSKVRNQIKRVVMVSKMINERLADYEKDADDYAKWESTKPNDGKYHWYPYVLSVKLSEIKRLMLVQRQEMIKLDKMI